MAALQDIIQHVQGKQVILRQRAYPPPQQDWPSACSHILVSCADTSIPHGQVLVMSSGEPPWLEACALGLGAARVTRIGPGRVSCQHPKLVVCKSASPGLGSTLACFNTPLQPLTPNPQLSTLNLKPLNLNP